jgi:dihydroorotate dehydrogenase (NAD+) catalytic subunit
MTVCGIEFRNPVLTASGTFGYGVEFEKLVDLNALGGIVVKLVGSARRHDQLRRPAERRCAGVCGG